jgi:hypothetical protein
MSKNQENFIEQTDLFIKSLYDQIEAFVENNSEAETIGEVVAEFNLLKKDFSDIYDRLCLALSDSMAEKGELTLSNGVKIEKKWSTTRKGWQHKNLASAVSEKIVDMSIDMDTGEIVLSPQEMLNKMLDYVQPSYWKAKPVSSLGIDIDNYCQHDDVKTSIIVRRSK